MTEKQDLETFFDAARKTRAEPSEALMARILEDAAREAPRNGTVASAGPAPRMSLWSQISDAIGGWPSLAGLVTATAAGVWIGIAAPDTVESLGGIGSGYELSDFLPGYGELSLDEG